VKNDLIKKTKNRYICLIASYNLRLEKKIHPILKNGRHDEISKVTPSTIKLIISSSFSLEAIKLLSETFFE